MQTINMIDANDTHEPVNAAGGLGERLISATPDENELLPLFIQAGARKAGYTNVLRLLWNCGFHPGENGFYPYDLIMPISANSLEVSWLTYPDAFAKLAYEIGLSEAELKVNLIEAIDYH
ncbi:hypothetical protein BH11CYA1_BH11CYA1_11600 [soil metagenome]